MEAVSDLMDAMDARTPLSEITKGDPGVFTVHLRERMGEIKKQEVVTLESFRDLTLKANALAEKILKGQAWIEEVTEKLERGVWASPRKDSQMREMVARNTCQLDQWNRDLDRMENEMVGAWAHYLRAQPGGRKLIERKNGERVYLSCKPVFDSPYPVWLPDSICRMLRVCASIGHPPQEVASDPERFLAEYCEVDPVHRAQRTRERRPSEKSGTMMKIDEPVQRPALGVL